LSNVQEKVFAKFCAVKSNRFESWIDTFLNGLSKMRMVRCDNMLNVIKHDLIKIATQEENKCIFQARDFNENNNEY